jgi:hypothetical protein
MLVALTTCGTRAEADVYAGGAFAAAGGVAANHIAKWNGDSWSALGSGIGGSAPYVYAIALSGNDVYAGGNFQTAGGGPANYIAKWDGNSWSAIGGGVNSSVRTVALGGNDVYAGGDFTTAGGGPANYIAKWDGNSWSPLGNGANLSVYAIAVPEPGTLVLLSLAGLAGAAMWLRPWRSV